MNLNLDKKCSEHQYTQQAQPTIGQTANAAIEVLDIDTLEYVNGAGGTVDWG
ncbi:MAG: hypothetical protein ACKO15_00290 [Burkholderiales bacterium]